MFKYIFDAICWNNSKVFSISFDLVVYNVLNFTRFVNQFVFFPFPWCLPEMRFHSVCIPLKNQSRRPMFKAKKNISILHLIGSRLNIIHFFYKRLKTKRKSKVIFCCCCWNSDNFPLTLIFRMSSFQIKFPNHSRPDL